MDIQTLLNNLHEELSCSVCMSKYTDPKQLPCLHSFCLHCLNGIQRTSGRRDKIACPECRQEFKIPENGNLAALPTNFRINSLLDVLAIKECSTTGVKCGNCDKRSKRSHYCFQCYAFWCEECISFHNGIKANKDHYTLALEEFQDQDFENILKRPLFCGIAGHEKKKMKFFCKICEVAICNACALLDHEGHAKMLLELAANERKLRLKSAIESQKKRAEAKKIQIEKLNERYNEVLEQAACVRENVLEYADSIHAAIEAKKLEILDYLERKTKSSLEQIGIHSNEMQKELQLCESDIENTETLIKRCTSAEIMQPNDMLDKIFKDENNHDDTANRERSFPRFCFVKNQKLFDLASVEQIGSLNHLTLTRGQQSSADGKGISKAIVGLEAQLFVTTRNAEGQQYHDDYDSVTLEIRNRQGDNCAAEVQVQDNQDGTYKIKYFAKETGTCSTSVKVNGEHIRGSPFEVKVKPRQFRPVLSFGEQILKNPWGVAVNEQDEIHVSAVGNHKIHLFKSDGTRIKSFGGEGKQPGEFSRPSGIALHANIIVAEQNNGRVQEVSKQGQYLSHFGAQGSLDRQLHRPCGLSIDSDGNILVADSLNKLIKIFSVEGQFLSKIGKENSFTKPFHCIQHDNYLIVSDTGDHSVKCFDRNGNFLYKFGTKGNADGEFNEPHCLFMNKAGHLMVCDTLNHRVQVFELSGKFVTKFGTKGGGIGEFDKPVSAAVLSDGKIIVTDFLNHRVQLFE